MPFIEPKLTPVNQTFARRTLDDRDPSVLGEFWEQPQPVGFLEGFRAGAQLENPVAEALRGADYLSVRNDVNPTFNATQFAKDNGVEDMLDQLLWANNEDYANAIVKHTLRERELRASRDASGWGGMLGSIFGGITSPTTLIPGLGLVRAVKGGYAVGRSATAVGGSAAGAIALDEAVLQSVQQERTASETAFAIGGGVLLGGLLGGVAASTLTKVERELFERGWKELNAATGASAGAEAVKRWSYDDMTPSGVAVRGIVNAIDFINPNIRLMTSASLVAREIGQQLGENTIYTRMHSDGFSAAPGGSAETKAFGLMQSTLGMGGLAVDDIYRAMKAAGTNMSWAEFDQAVGRALRRGDVGENEFVTQAAQTWRQATIDRLKDEAIRAELLPPDVSISEAASYFSRVYNTEKIIAQEMDFKNRIMPWVQQRIVSAFEKSQAKTLERIERLRADIDDLKLGKEERLQALADIDAGMSRLAMEYREGFEVDQDIKALNRQAAKAKKEGDPAKAQALKDQAKAMSAAADEYRKAVAPLLRRRKVIERGVGGTDNKIDKLQNQLVNLEEANLTSLRRLVAKGQWLQKELDKVPAPEDLKELVEKLSETFNQVAKQFDDGLDRIAELNRKIEEDIAGLKEKQGTPETGVERAQKFEEYKRTVGPVQERIRKFEEAQKQRQVKLNRLAQQMEDAELMDVVEVQNALKQMTEELVADISSMSLGRGERAARLLARIDELSPEKVLEKIAQMEARVKSAEEAFRQRWETGLLGKDVDLRGAKPDFSIAAQDAVNDIFDAITGKSNFTTSSEIDPWRISPRRGPLKERTFHIPDEVIEDFLNSSARQVNEIMARRMAGQVAMKWRFGSTTLEPQLKAIKKDYDRLQSLVSSADSYEQALREIGQHFGFKEKLKHRAKGEEKNIEGLKLWLNNEMKSDIEDVQNLRDLILGRYAPQSHSSNWGRFVRAVNQINYTRMSGKFGIAALSDMYRPALVQGFRRSLGILPKMLSDSVTKDGLKVTDAVRREAQLAGLILDRFLHSRMASVAELGDPFAHGSRTERFIENITRLSTKWNGIALMQDAGETWSSFVSQNNIIDALKTGGFGKFNETWLAYLGLDKQSGTARQVAEQLEKHAEKVDGLWIANTEKWDNFQAVDAYRNALRKEVTRTIVRPSQGDVPTFMKTPLGGGLFQFRSFMLSSHQRIMLAGLQEGPARFLSGMTGAIGVGMMVAYLKAVSNGQEAFDRFKEKAKNPGYLIGEGIDNSALFPLFFELSNSTEKVTKGMGLGSFNPIKSPMAALYDGKFDVDSQKTWGVPTEQALLGPFASTAWAATKAAGAAVKAASGEELSKGQIRDIQRAVPFGTHLGLGQIIQLLNDDLAHMR